MIIKVGKIGSNPPNSTAGSIPELSPQLRCLPRGWRSCGLLCIICSTPPSRSTLPYKHTRTHPVTHMHVCMYTHSHPPPPNVWEFSRLKMGWDGGEETEEELTAPFIQDALHLASSPPSSLICLHLPSPGHKFLLCVMPGNLPSSFKALPRESQTPL